MQHHKIQLIGQLELPANQDWALVEHDGQIILFIKEHALTPHCLEEAWAAYRQLTKPRHPRVILAQPRMESPLLNSA